MKFFCEHERSKTATIKSHSLETAQHPNAPSRGNRLNFFREPKSVENNSECTLRGPYRLKTERGLQTEWWSNHLDLKFVVDDTHAMSSFVMRSPVPWNMAVRPDATRTCAGKKCLGNAGQSRRWTRRTVPHLASTRRHLDQKARKTNSESGVFQPRYLVHELVFACSPPPPLLEHGSAT